MTNTFVPGYQAYVKVGTDSVEGNLTGLSFSQSYGDLVKPVAGDQEPTSIRGVGSHTVSMQGHVSVEDHAKFQTACESNADIAYEVQIGTAAGSEDVGKYTGNMKVTSFESSFDTEDQWSFTLAARLQALPTYTDSV